MSGSLKARRLRTDELALRLLLVAKSQACYTGAAQCTYPKNLPIAPFGAAPAAIVADRNNPQKHLLRLEGGAVDRRSVGKGMARSCGRSVSVWRWRERYIDEGVDGLIARQDAAPAPCL